MQEQPIYSWPTSHAVIGALIESLLQEAEDQLGTGWRLSYVSPAQTAQALEQAPGLPAAVSQAIAAFEPNDHLWSLLDQAVSDLARTSLSLLPQDQRTALRQAAAEHPRDLPPQG